jgi:3-oxoadipate CoA-transferase, alpha subunit
VWYAKSCFGRVGLSAFPDRQRTDPNASILDHGDKSFPGRFADRRQICKQQRCLSLRPAIRFLPEKNHRRLTLATQSEERPEVGIGRNQHAILPRRESHGALSFDEISFAILPRRSEASTASRVADKSDILRNRMLDKIVQSPEAALAGVRDGATVMIGGFGGAGIPNELIDALIAHGARDLTIVNNNAGTGETGVAALLKAGRVRKIICSYPRQVDSYVFDALYRSGRIELELVPQGNLAERMRAAGAGIGAFFTPTAYGTDLAKGKETRVIDGRHYVLEYPLHGDLALVKAERADRWGNLVYRKAARNFGPVMASAAKCTVAQVYEVVELGQLDPETIVTPGIFVSRVVRVPRAAAVRAAA